MNDSIVDTPQFKTCTNPDCPCDNPQPIEGFRHNKNTKDGRESRCKTCRSKEFSDYYYSNIEYNRQRVIDHYWLNPELKREKRRKAYVRNAPKEREQAKSRARKNPQVNKQWKINNPDKTTAMKQRRRARKNNLPDCLNSLDWRGALDYFGGFCAVCGRPPGLWHTLAMDHWIPLSNPECPGTIPTNIVPLCHGVDGCNNSKQNKPPEQWLIQRFGERKTKKILRRIHDYFDSLRK